MTTPTPLALAREGLELAEKATPGPWYSAFDDRGYADAVETPKGPANYGGVILNKRIVCPSFAAAGRNLRLIAHAGTNYGTLCRALIAAEERAVKDETRIAELLQENADLHRALGVDKETLERLRGMAGLLICEKVEVGAGEVWINPEDAKWMQRK